MELLRIENQDDLRRHHRRWIEESLRSDNHDRESKWTESIAVGSKAFVEQTKERLGVRVRGRRVTAKDGVYELRESESRYSTDSTGTNSDLSADNTYYWNVSHYTPMA
jgi:putative transposase